MSILTVRNLPPEVKARLRIQAAEHGWAMEEEVRRILTRATLGDSPTDRLGSRIRDRFSASRDELELLPRRPPRRPPAF